MKRFNQSVEVLIQNRFSCRKFKPVYIAEADLTALQETMTECENISPFASDMRFLVVAADPQDSDELRNLGTYGLIKDPHGFIIGAVRKSPTALVDYGFAFQVLLLHAADLGLDTCWLGGNFTRSSFSQRIDLANDEILPAVSPIGYAAENIRNSDVLRKVAHSDQRKAWAEVFFKGDFDHPLTPQDAGKYANALEMLRLAPSAKNKQPWRVVQEGESFHFYLQRSTKGLLDLAAAKALQMEDLELVDIGIAMSHFWLMLDEQGIPGQWTKTDHHSSEGMEYVCSWVG